MALTRLGLNQSINLASNVTGTLPTANGGTGATSFTAGKVLQTVYAQSSTEVSSTNTTWVDVVSASITPAATSNKILVLGAAGGLNKSGGDTQLNLRIIRDSTQIAETKGNNTGSSDGLFVPGAPLNELDEPSSTSSLTYKIQLQNRDAAGTVVAGQNGADSSLTLMEIAG